MSRRYFVYDIDILDVQGIAEGKNRIPKQKNNQVWSKEAYDTAQNHTADIQKINKIPTPSVN